MTSRAAMRNCAVMGLALAALASCRTAPGEHPATVTSWKDRREQNVVMQKFDFSCGTASLATLLRYHFGDVQVCEADLLQNILNGMAPADIEDRRTKGLSMLDLRDCARRRGYTAEGLKLELKDLQELTGPVVAHMTRDGLSHFVVLRGIRGDRAYLADPSFGNLTVQTATFASEWSGFILYVDREGFAPPKDDPLALDADDRTSAMPRTNL